MKPVVYVETSIVSYLAARPSRDLVVAARQETTRDWWDERARLYDLRISALVIQEIKQGDANVSRERVKLTSDIAILVMTKEAEQLAELLIRKNAVPKKASEDALHIALAVVHNVDYLLTWNFKHINNAEKKLKLAQVINGAGYECPVICSPEELMGG